MQQSGVRFTVFLLVMSALALPLKAQCLQDAEIIARVATINSNTAYNPAKKIKGLKELQAAFLKCKHLKNNAYAQIVHRIGDQYSKAGDVERAIFYTREAMQVNLGAGPGLEKSFLTHSYFNLGVFYKRLQLLAESHHYFNLCIRTGRNYQEKHFIVFMAYEQDAFSFFQTGDYQKSIEIANAGLLFAESLKNELARAPLLAQKAQSETLLNNFDQAEDDIKKATALLEKSGSDAPHLATCYSIYADLLNRKKRSRESLAYYQKSFSLNRDAGLLQQSSIDLMDIGSIYLNALNQGSKALEYYRKGIRLANTTGDKYQLAGLYTNMGVVCWKNGHFREALRYHQKALNTLPLNFTDTSISANLSLDMLKLVSNDYFVSTILANKGSALLSLYKKEKDRKLLQLALRTYVIADQCVDVMRWKQSGEQSKLLWRKNTKRMYGEAIDACYELGNTERAWYFFEKSRAVLLGDQLRELTAASYLAIKDRMAEKQLRVKTYTLSQKLLLLSKTDQNYSSQYQQWHDAQEKWEDFIKSLERKYPVYYQYKYDNSVYAYTSVIRKLSADKRSLIAYFNGDAAMYVLLLSPAGQKLVKLPDTMYRKNAKELLALIADKALLNQQYDRYDSVANQLYLQLFKPLHVTAGRVIISPDELFIPFEALISDLNKRNSFLAKQYIFSYVHSMSVVLKGTNQAVDKPTFFGIAPVNYSKGQRLAPLLGSGESLRKIAPSFAASELLIGREATRAQFFKKSTAYNIIQVYAHADGNADQLSNNDGNAVQLGHNGSHKNAGQRSDKDAYARADPLSNNDVDEDNGSADLNRNAKDPYSNVNGRPKEPVLYLADSAVYLSEIQKMTFPNTELAVLSACNTGVGHHAEGEGIFSLARAFTVAGVPGTVTNLWQVDNKVTYQITELFYKYLQAGLPKDVALNRAKLDLMANADHLYDLPYYWAATVMIGNTDSINHHETSALLTTVLIASAVLFTLILYLWLSRQRRFRRKP